MNARVDALRRLMSLYGSIEEMHSVELQRTISAVREAEQAMEAEERSAHSSNVIGRDALMAGDRMKWAAARTQREIAEWKQERLRQVRLEREKLSEEVQLKYQASRLRSEQLQHVVEEAATEIAIQAGRQTQAALDDRFLARRRWTDALDESRMRTG
jgi:hypothetical protein